MTDEKVENIKTVAKGKKSRLKVAEWKLLTKTKVSFLKPISMRTMILMELKRFSTYTITMGKIFVNKI